MRTTPHYGALLALSGAMLTAAAPAHAFDPNAGAEAISAAPNFQAPPQRLPNNIIPGRYYSQDAAPVAATAPTPQPTIIAPPIVQAPIAPAYVAPATSYPLTSAPIVHVQPARSDIYRANRFSFGIEGYYDDYREDVVDLKDQGFFGSVTAGYAHYFNPNLYGGLELRGSRGSVDYESISGTIDDISQWEAEGRLLVGYDQAYGDAQRIKFYAGGGTRFFYDEFKGKVSSTGASGYDRRILQFYIPVGVTYEFQAYGLTFSPNIEYNQFIYGYVESRLQSIPGFQELNNSQHDGYGLRGEFLVGQTDTSGRGWQFGPFIRYWDIKDSEIDITPALTGLEPANTRLQVGAKLKVLF